MLRPAYPYVSMRCVKCESYLEQEAELLTLC